MVGPLKMAPGGFEYLLVTVDKFTKLIEVKFVTSAAVEPVIKFISNIIHWFVFHHSIITDNGTNFMAEAFRDYCYKCYIIINYTSVAHPQSNGHVERANGLVLGK